MCQLQLSMKTRSTSSLARKQSEFRSAARGLLNQRILGRPIQVFDSTELFTKTFRGLQESGGRNSGNLPEYPAGNRKMNFMIDADDAHPAHSSFPNGDIADTLSRASFSFSLFLSPSLFLAVSLRKLRDGRNRERKVSAYRETRRLQETSSVIPDPINRSRERKAASFRPRLFADQMH